MIDYTLYKASQWADALGSGPVVLDAQPCPGEMVAGLVAKAVRLVGAARSLVVCQARRECEEVAEHLFRELADFAGFPSVAVSPSRIPCGAMPAEGSPQAGWAEQGN